MALGELQTTLARAGKQKQAATAAFAATLAAVLLHLPMPEEMPLAGGSGSNGGGVCLYGTFYLSGDSIIQNNTKAGATDNLYLGWNTIKITGPLGENARIGVTAEGVPRSFISGWSDNMAGENPADYFSSDGDALGIGLNADGNVVLAACAPP